VVLLVVGITVVSDTVTLSAPAGSTMRSIAKNTANGMTDDPLPRDIHKPPPAGLTVDFLFLGTLL
jgi:hypothetical protein